MREAPGIEDPTFAKSGRMWATLRQSPHSPTALRSRVRGKGCRSGHGRLADVGHPGDPGTMNGLFRGS